MSALLSVEFKLTVILCLDGQLAANGPSWTFINWDELVNACS